MVDISVIIASYNTRELTIQSVNTAALALEASLLKWEIIVVDNASTDDSLAKLTEYVKGEQFPITILENNVNVGFGAANNIAIARSTGEFILLLNSDTIVDNVHFDKLIAFAREQTDFGGLTVKLLLSDGSIDPACHRGFPTPWRSFCYMSGLEKLTNNVPSLKPLFGGYHLTHLPLDEAHQIDTPSGAFFLMKKVVFDAAGGFDEQFFMYGEDIDLAYRIHKMGKSIWYRPEQSITHLKGQSGMQRTDMSQNTRQHFYQAMKIFYQKHYEELYPTFLNQLIYKAIDYKLAKPQGQPNT